MDAVSLDIVSPIARNGRLLRWSKIGETVQVASVYWYVGCVEVKPKHKITNRLAALEEKDDGEMAHPPGSVGTYDVCAVQESQKVKRVEVTVDSGAEESVWPAKLLQEIPTVKGEGGREEFLVANGQEMGHYGQKKIKFGGETACMKTMSFEVTDVPKLLVAVHTIMEKGNEVHFGKGRIMEKGNEVHFGKGRIMEKGNEVHFGRECYIRNVHTGETIPMRRKGAYVVDIDVNIDDASFYEAGLISDESSMAVRPVEEQDCEEESMDPFSCILSSTTTQRPGNFYSVVSSYKQHQRQEERHRQEVYPHHPCHHDLSTD